MSTSPSEQVNGNGKGSQFHVVNIQNLTDKGHTVKIDSANDGHVSLLLDNELSLRSREKFDPNNVYFTCTTCDNCLTARYGNTFIGAFLEAYNNHRDIMLSPDDMWNVILMQLSKHINAHAEQLRSQFVSHDGQVHLTIQDFAGSVEESLRLEKDWKDTEFFPRMLEKIRENTAEGVVAMLQGDFTSTTTADQIFSIATIMDSFKKYFTYGRMICMCGINNVRFMGTLEDWTRLRDKTAALAKYALAAGDVWAVYIDRVLVILDKFVDTYQGRVDVAFWNTIVATEQIRIGSGGDVQTNIQGWLLHFLGIYVKTDLDDIPSHTISVPIKLQNEWTNTEKDLTLLGGFTGIHYHEGAYRPQLGLVLYHFQNPVQERKSFW